MGLMRSNTGRRETPFHTSILKRFITDPLSRKWTAVPWWMKPCYCGWHQNVLLLSCTHQNQDWRCVNELLVTELFNVWSAQPGRSNNAEMKEDTVIHSTDTKIMGLNKTSIHIYAPRQGDDLNSLKNQSMTSVCPFWATVEPWSISGALNGR